MLAALYVSETSEFYRLHHELVSDFNVGLNFFSSESEFNGDLVYKFKTIKGKTNFSDQFPK